LYYLVMGLSNISRFSRKLSTTLIYSRMKSRSIRVRLFREPSYTEGTKKETLNRLTMRRLKKD
jgi:hypothetical protein